MLTFSLLTLKIVISKLAESASGRTAGHINYRDSKLYVVLSPISLTSELDFCNHLYQAMRSSPSSVPSRPRPSTSPNPSRRSPSHRD